jgi:SAM-dependent methyltransferase
MNSKILNLVTDNLYTAFALPKYDSVRRGIDTHTVIADLPWTPARYRKFKDAIQKEMQFEFEDYSRTLQQTVEELDRRYLRRFFGEIWKPRTGDYQWTGWALVDEIKRHNPASVLDVGCGYNQFKERLPNLIGIDPYNDCADYMVDILEYQVSGEQYDAIMALGSINFNSSADVEKRFAHCVDLLAPGGRFYLRANPGIQWPNGPWVDIFAWNFAFVKELEKRYNLRLETFKQDGDNSPSGRLYFVYSKP